VFVFGLLFWLIGVFLHSGALLVAKLKYFCKMAGIYIHIPYCKKKCHYCNFFSLATHKYRNVFVDALLNEIHQRKAEVSLPISSIYFGGGTPSLLSRKELDAIFNQIHQYYSVESEIEITLEANPDDLTSAYLSELQKTEVNRLSIGIQSFNDNDLESVNRAHTGRQAYDSVLQAQQAGFKNLSLDLIYGIPSSSLQIWEENLKKIRELDADHLSAYSLTQEPQTAYDVLVKKGKLKAPDDEKAIEQYEMLQNYLPELKMEQYEISNYARNQKYALHNTSYWKGIPYIGFGPSAHSYNGNYRRWNIAQLKGYLDSVEGGMLRFEQEKLSLYNQWNEWMMTGLRTKWGIDLHQKPHTFPQLWADVFKQKAQKFILQELLFRSGTQYFLTEKGKLFADGIAAEFFHAEGD
jgi:oxygen-independent coproporphyrinogen-3 oxidase